MANDFNKKVLLIDANFSAPNIGLYLDMKKDFTLHHVLNGDEGLHAAIYEAFGMDIVPTSMHFNDEVDPFKLKNILEKHKHRYDFIIIDSSPHHSEMIPAMAAADKIFVVTTPDRVTLHTSVKAAMIAKKNNSAISGVIINKIKDSRFESDLKEIEQVMNLPVVARIKDHKKLLEAGFYKIPITVYDSLNEISREVKRLAGALSGEKEKIRIWDFIFRKHYRPEHVNRELMRQNFYENQIK